MPPPLAAGIPLIDVSALFAAPSRERERTDRAILKAAAGCGFFVAQDFAADVPIDAASRRDLLHVFRMPEPEIRRLWRQKFDASHANIYRGWFPLQAGHLTSKEGIDLGPDVAFGSSVVRSGDPLREATPLPAEQALPGWRAAAARYYRALTAVSEAVMHSIARSLALPEGYFDAAFHQGLSTLRLIHYPVRSAGDLAAADSSVWVWHRGERCYLTGAPHVDSGFLTLLAQDGVPGLQACRHDGEWIDVPPAEGTLAVNFGKVLERWSAGRIKATPHRVLGSGRSRMCIPFFYEARAEAEFRPLPMDPAHTFEPFLYGDYLWATTTKFVEFRGLESLRTPLGA